MTDAAQVLVLEDDPNMRELIQDLLTDEGYLVVSAARGEQAVELATQSRLDLIVFDIRMEGIDGLQALARIQEGGGWDIPSLAITGFAGDDDPIRAMRMGVGAYLRKPFQPEQLLEAAARLIEANRRKLLDQQSTQSLREVLRWGLGQMSGKPGPSPPAQLFARLSSELAEAVGLPSNTATCLELATLILTAAPEARLQPDCPAVVRAWSDYLEERYDGQGPKRLQGNDIPLQTRLVAVAHGGSTLQEGETPDLLVERFPGRYDPYLLEALGKLRPGVRPRGPFARLGLARALLARGDSAKAVTVLQELVTQEPSSEVVNAWLILAQLQSQPDSLQQACEVANRVGPVTLARTLYEAGVLLARAQAPGAQAYFEKARHLLAVVGCPTESNLARLLAGDLDAQAIQQVLRPEHSQFVTSVIDLLLPALCAPSHDPEREKQLRRLAVRYPHMARQTALSFPHSNVLTEPQSLPPLRVVSFGALQAFWGDEPIEDEAWRGPFAKNLFAFLASQESSIHEEALLDLFWPEAEGSYKRRLSSALSSIRRTLGLENKSRMDPVQRLRDRYQINPELPFWHDLNEFRRHHLAATRHLRENRQTEAVEHWNHMVSLHQAPYLDGCYLPWALALREQMAELCLQALCSLGEVALETQPEISLDHGRRATQQDPLHQRAQLLLLNSYLKLSQPEVALRQYQRYADLLQRELGVEPVTELIAVYHRAKLALP